MRMVSSARDHDLWTSAVRRGGAQRLPEMGDAAVLFCSPHACSSRACQCGAGAALFSAVCGWQHVIAICVYSSARRNATIVYSAQLLRKRILKNRLGTREPGACTTLPDGEDCGYTILQRSARLSMRGCGVALVWGRRGPVRGRQLLLPNQRLGRCRASNTALLCFRPHLLVVSCCAVAMAIYSRPTGLCCVSGLCLGHVWRDLSCY